MDTNNDGCDILQKENGKEMWENEQNEQIGIVDKISCKIIEWNCLIVD